MAGMQSIDTEKAREFAAQTVSKLRKAGFLSYWAGGCVRDHHLQKTPKDYDVATNAVPDEIRKLFGKRRTLAIGESFGVITLIGSKDQGNIEIATFREDISYSDGRRPDRVTYSTPEIDAHRRDFTINGMFLDPTTMETIDYVGGLVDLESRLIRAIGDPVERFDEDKLRIFRAIRFATTLAFDIEPNTLSAVRKYAGNLSQVSRERILVELQKTISSPHRTRGIQLLYETGILPYVLPGTMVDEQSIELVKALLTRLPIDDTALSLTAIYRALAPESPAGDVRKTIKSMKASNDIATAVFWMLQNVEHLMNAHNKPWPLIQRLLVDPLGPRTLQLADALATASNLCRDGIVFCEQKLQLCHTELNPEAFLKGADLIELGMTPGQAFSKVLAAVRDAQLLGEITTPEDARKMAQEIYSSYL